MARVPRVPKLEYKCPADNAWYAVSLNYGRAGRRPAYFHIHFKRVRPEGEVRQVDLENMNEVQEALQRFRLESDQLQDPQCGLVGERMDVCASYQSPGDLRFYDTHVMKVYRYAHLADQKGSLKCFCSFEVQWNEGPGEGTITAVRSTNICLLKPGGVDHHPGIQFLRSFLN